MKLNILGQFFKDLSWKSEYLQARTFLVTKAKTPNFPPTARQIIYLSDLCQVARSLGWISGRITERQGVQDQSLLLPHLFTCTLCRTLSETPLSYGMTARGIARGKSILYLGGIHDQIQLTCVYYLHLLHGLITNRDPGFVLLAAYIRQYLVIFCLTAMSCRDVVLSSWHMTAPLTWWLLTLANIVAEQLLLWKCLLDPPSGSLVGKLHQGKVRDHANCQNSAFCLAAGEQPAAVLRDLSAQPEKYKESNRKKKRGKRRMLRKNEKLWVNGKEKLGSV